MSCPLRRRSLTQRPLFARAASFAIPALFLAVANSAYAYSVAPSCRGLGFVACVLVGAAPVIELLIELLFSWFGVLLLIGAVVGFVWWHRRRKARQGAAGAPKRLIDINITWEKVKRTSVSGAIALLLPLFVQLLSRSIAPEATVGLNLVALWTEVALAGVFIGAGLVSRHVRVVGYGLMLGGLFSLVYTITERFHEFSAGVQLLISALGLLATLSFSVAMTLRDLAARRLSPTLSGLRGVLLAILAFIFSLMVVGLAENYVEEITTNLQTTYAVSGTYIQNVPLQNVSGVPMRSSMPPYPSPKTSTSGLLVALVLGVAYLILGAGSRTVGKHVGAALFLAGLITIIRVLLSGITEFGQSIAAVVTGVSVLALIVFAYVKFGRSSSAPSATLPPAPPV